MAVVGWVQQTWAAEVGFVAAEDADPAETLVALARNHAVYCRRDVAAVLLNLRVEFHHQDHPVGRAITELVDQLRADCVRLIEAGRARGCIPAGPPAGDTAEAFIAALEAVAIGLAGRAPHDVELAERVARGVLALPHAERAASDRSTEAGHG